MAGTVRLFYYGTRMESTRVLIYRGGLWTSESSFTNIETTGAVAGILACTGVSLSGNICSVFVCWILDRSERLV